MISHDVLANVSLKFNMLFLTSESPGLPVYSSYCIAKGRRGLAHDRGQPSATGTPTPSLASPGFICVLYSVGGPAHNQLKESNGDP